MLALNSIHCLFTVILVAALAQTATSDVQCYDCSSPVAGECGDGFKASLIATKPCSGPLALCSTRVQKHNDLIIRGCVTSSSNVCNSGEFSSCSTCGKDLCNVSFKFAPSLYIIILSIVSAFFAKYVV